MIRRPRNKRVASIWSRLRRMERELHELHVGAISDGDLALLELLLVALLELVRLYRRTRG